jgi:site-specific DNA recombinase
MVAQIMASVAEFERERTGERRREAAGALRQEVRFGGGRVPYGYAAVQTPGGSGWLLEPDPVTALVVRDLASRMITGSSANSLCAELNEKGVRSPAGGRWHAQNLIRIMRSASLKGLVVTAKGEIVRDDEGMPVRREPVLDDSTWARLQQELDSASHAVSGHRSDAALLLRVAFCGACSSPMYAQRGRRQGRDYEYYVDSGRKDGCQAGAVRMALLEDMVETALLHELGELPMLEKLSLPGDEDHSGEIREREEFLAEIDADYADGKISGERHHALAAIQEARLAALRALPSRPASSGWIETGELFGEHWANLGNTERHLLLLQFGVRADVYRHHDGMRAPLLEVPSAREDGTVIRQTLLASSGEVAALVRLGDLAVLRDRATRPRK